MEQNIEEKLNEIYELVVINENTFDKFKEFKMFEISLSEIDQYIIPFLARISNLFDDKLEEGNLLSAAETLDYFTCTYFGEIKENGFYKGTKLSVLKDWICLDCEDFFYLSDTQIELDKISCTNCGSNSFRHSTKIQKAHIDGLSAHEIIEQFKLKTNPFHKSVHFETFKQNSKT
jgi:DNA-directed RNA polymerase subunit RPC12/RpoP